MTAPRSPSWLLQPTYPPYRVLPKVLSRRRIDRPVMCAVARRKQKVTFPALPSLCRTSPVENVFEITPPPQQPRPPSHLARRSLSSSPCRGGTCDNRSESQKSCTHTHIRRATTSSRGVRREERRRCAALQASSPWRVRGRATRKGFVEARGRRAVCVV